MVQNRTTQIVVAHCNVAVRLTGASRAILNETLSAPRRDFAAQYRSTLTPLLRYLTRLLGNRSEAQDIAHDAYLRVYPTVDKPTTARRLAINQVKRQ